MEYTGTYHVERTPGIELDIQEIDRTKINYNREKNRLKIISNDIEFSISVLRLNNPEVNFTKIKNGS